MVWKKIHTLHIAWDDSPPNMTKINLVIKTLKHSYLNYWRHIVNEFSNTKLGVYQAIKTHFGIDNYLMDIKCRKARAALTAIRTSAHTLEIERGRYCSPKVPRNSDYVIYAEKRSERNWGRISHAHEM